MINFLKKKSNSEKKKTFTTLKNYKKQTKVVKDIYNENFRTPKKEIEENNKKWKDLPYSDQQN